MNLLQFGMEFAKIDKPGVGAIITLVVVVGPVLAEGFHIRLCGC